MQKIPTTATTIIRDPAEINTIRDTETGGTEGDCERVCGSSAVTAKERQSLKNVSVYNKRDQGCVSKHILTQVDHREHWWQWSPQSTWAYKAFGKQISV
ncbi:hypothetical protein PO909_028077 [Leuciscus waleckii]